MIKIRKSNERGHFDHGWLNTFHSFSFADYYDPANMGFRSLRVINQDWIEAAAGFGTHPHKDMEIITYVLSGALEHKDSMGNGSVIYPGDVQKMSAGTGITHSEFNHSKNEPATLLQIWIIPEKHGITPGYAQKTYSDEEKKGKFRLIASRDGRDDSVVVYQDVDLYASILDENQELVYEIKPERGVWIQIARGSVKLNDGFILENGDGVAFRQEKSLKIKGIDSAEILLFDLG